MYNYLLLQNSKVKTIISRSFIIYLLLYFLFISNNSLNYPYLDIVNIPLRYLSEAIGHFATKLIFHEEFKERHTIDSYWTYTKLFSFVTIAVFISLIWTISDNGKRSHNLFKYMHIFARYYLALVLFTYGLDKLFSNQFFLNHSQLLQPVGNLNPYQLFWTFMGASKSYQIFAGIIEITSGMLLLFRRTSTLGAIIAFTTLINILMMNIAYDVAVKVIVFHLLLFDVLILLPDIKRIFRFLLLKKNERLLSIPPLTINKRNRVLFYALKAILIGLAIIPLTKSKWELKYKLNHPSHKIISGIHEINSFFLNHTAKQVVSTDTSSWKKVAINDYPYLTILYSNDSIHHFDFVADTLHQILEIDDGGDSTSKFTLHYSIIITDNWLFEGIFRNDSIRFTTKLIDINRLPLMKDYGKIKWSYK